MTASTTQGKGVGAAAKTFNRELTAILNGPAIYAAGVIPASETITSPPSSGNTVVLPTPLPGGSDSYVVMLTSLNGGSAYVTNMEESNGFFVSFDFNSEADCDMMYLVVKKGHRMVI